MNSTSSLPRFSQPVSFTACSFLKPGGTSRRRLLRKTLATWRNLLDLPFAERIFLDDRSPDSAATRLLEEIGLAGKFDQVRYQDTPHPPHSNFGIVGSFELGSSPYLLHLDDDVKVSGPPGKLHAYIEQVLRILSGHPEILGINLLELNPGRQGFRDWAQGEPYGTSGLYHPHKYFGTCASIIRRELLARGDFRQILGWNENQPGNWEVLVTRDTREFLVAPPGSPFSISLNSLLFQSTPTRSLPGLLWECCKKELKGLYLNAVAPRSRD